jgi:hypothetical protein
LVGSPRLLGKCSTWWEEVSIPYGTLMYQFHQKLKNFKQHLREWNKTIFGNIFQAQRDLEQMDEGNSIGNHSVGFPNPTKRGEEHIKLQLEERYAQE